MTFGRVEMKVNGEPVSIDFEEEMEIGDVSEDMIKVAAQMAYWGQVWAAAEAEKLRADAAYRQWRADQTKMVLESDPKLAEWKCKAHVEESDTFVSLKAAMAEAERQVISAKTIHDAFKVKAHVLQSKGAMFRAEGFATGVHTPESPKEPRRSSEERDERVSAMRTLNRKKKVKKKSKPTA